MGKLIHWELCKILKFDHTAKWYMYKLEFVLENETHEPLGDFEIQTDHLIPARRADLVIINKKKKKDDFAVPADHRVKIKKKIKIKIKKKEKREKYLHLARELKKERESNYDITCNWCAWNGPKELGNIAGRVSFIWVYCNLIAEGFRFIHLAFRFSQAENLSLSAWVS